MNIISDLVFKPKLLFRNRIKKIFDNIFNFPLFLIIASTGYSKTTSLRKFLSTKKNINQIWLSLEIDEIDDIWIWQKLCFVIQKNNPDLAYKLSNYGLPKNNMDMEHLISLIKDNVNKPTVFIIDNFQELKSCATGLLIENLVYKKVPNFHIIVVSRIFPDFKYAELSLKGYCYIVEQNVIAFNADDTYRFFKLNGIILSEDEKNTLLNYTEGWVSATYLALLYYVKNHNFGKLDNYTQLIRTTVYDKFNSTTKEIIMKLSLIENFTIKQAIAVTENKKSVTIIRHLTSSNCFIKYDKKHNMYTLHSILKTVAFDDIKNSNIDTNRIINLCANWYHQQNQLIPCIVYYNKLKEYEIILNIIEENLKEGLFNKAPTIMLNIFNNMDIKQKLKHPIVFIAFIHFYIITIDKLEGASLLLKVKRIYLQDTSLHNRNEILGEIYLVERITNFNDINKMDECLDKAYRYFGAKTSKIYSYNTIFNFASTHNLNIFHNKKGKLLSIVKNTEKNFWKYNVITNGCGAGYEYLIKAEYCYEIGDIETAELFAYKAKFKAEIQNQLIIVANATFVLIKIAILNGKYRDLKDYLEELTNTIYQDGKQFLISQFDIIKGYIYICLSQIENVPLWISEYKLNSYNYSIQNKEQVYIIHGKMMIKQRKFYELLEISNVLLYTCDKSKLIFNIIFAKIFCCIAKYNLYGLEQARQPLIEAINIARLDNIIMIFVENSPEIIPILSSINEKYVDYILNICKQFVNGINRINNFKIIENFNSREQKIIELLIKGYTSTQIGKELSIAPVTVNKTLSNIYKTLNVKNRVSAVTKIKDL